jgi:uncharacterized protein DUF389
MALETRASSAVGVAISVTTIPVSAYLGVAAGTGALSKSLGALSVLGANVTMMLVGGCLTLLAQRAAASRDEGARPGAASRDGAAARVEATSRDA